MVGTTTARRASASRLRRAATWGDRSARTGAGASGSTASAIARRRLLLRLVAHDRPFSPAPRAWWRAPTPAHAERVTAVTGDAREMSHGHHEPREQRAPRGAEVSTRPGGL